MTLQELQRRRAELGAAIGSFRDKLFTGEGEQRTPRAMNSEERTEWERINKAYDENEEAITVAERSARIQSQIDGDRQAQDDAARRSFDSSRPASGAGAARRSFDELEELRTLALRGWCREQFDITARPEEREAAEQIGFNLNRREIGFDLCDSTGLARLQRAFADGDRPGAERRAMSAENGIAGGTLIPSGFVRRLEVNMLAFGGVLDAAEIIRTATGEPLEFPTMDDTTNVGARIGENQSIGSSVRPSTGSEKIGAYTYSSKPVLVPHALLEDAAFDVNAILSGALGERLGRKQAIDFTTGSGAGEPWGMVTRATTGKTAASATAISGDDVIDLVHSVDSAYRAGARFMMHDAVLAHVRKLKDGNGQYLWQSGLTEGTPDRLYGYPISVNFAMASSVAASATTMIFGRLSAYKVRQVRGIRLYRLTERYRDSDQDGFIAFIRADGNLLSAGTAPYKALVQAAS